MKKAPLIILIAGGSCSGKTFLGKKIIEEQKASLLCLDMYYKNKKWSHSRELELPEAFDWELLESNLNCLIAKGECRTPVYDFLNSTRAKETRILYYNPIIIIEGLYAFYVEKCSFPYSMNFLKVYIEASEKSMLQRRIKRDRIRKNRTESQIKENFNRYVLPAFQKHISHQKHQADLCIYNETHRILDSCKLKNFIQKHLQTIMHRL